MYWKYMRNTIAFPLFMRKWSKTMRNFEKVFLSHFPEIYGTFSVCVCKCDVSSLDLSVSPST